MLEPNLEILKRYLENKTDSKESEFVKKWLLEINISEAELASILAAGEGVGLFAKIDEKEDWSKVRRKLFPQKKTVSLKFILKAAAAIIILVGLYGLLFSISKYIHRPNIIVNNSAKVETVLLPDSSCVYLNSAASISYLSNFEKKRDLKLKGLAFFEVKKNSKKPFTVNANDCKIRVLGTSFSIETRQKDVEVIVATGKVAFYTTNEKSVIFLTKGQKGIYSAETRNLLMKKNEDVNYLAWQNHILLFNNSSIYSVARDLEKYFRIKIILNKNISRGLHYTSEFHNPAITDILNEMELVLNIKYKITGDSILISSK